MKEALNRPVAMIVGATDGVDMPNWLSEPYGDLWGNDANGTGKTDLVGTKSIYDPCPKGWRVADMAAFEYLIEHKDLFTFYEDTESAYKGAPGCVYNGNLHMLSAGYIWGKFHATNGRLMTEGGGDIVSNKSQTTIASTWSNLAPGATGAQPYAFMHGTKVKFDDGSRFKSGNFNRTSAFPVRCQVDTDNR